MTLAVSSDAIPQVRGRAGYWRHPRAVLSRARCVRLTGACPVVPVAFAEAGLGPETHHGRLRDDGGPISAQHLWSCRRGRGPLPSTYESGFRGTSRVPVVRVSGGSGALCASERHRGGGCALLPSVSGRLAPEQVGRQATAPCGRCPQVGRAELAHVHARRCGSISVAMSGSHPSGGCSRSGWVTSSYIAEAMSSRSSSVSWAPFAVLATTRSRLAASLGRSHGMSPRPIV